MKAKFPFLVLIIVILATIVIFSKSKEESIVAVELENKSNIYSLKNTGTTQLKIEIYESNESITKITGAIILDIKEKLVTEIKKPTIFVAKQNE